MTEEKTYKVTPPFSFNMIKHHLGHIRSKGRKALTATDLVRIGGSQMDLYTGELSVAEIIMELQTFLKNIGAQSRLEFLEWAGEFRTTELSDGSTWVLRGNEHPVQYIHIHPARKSNHTIRIKANTLKTVLLAFSHIHAGLSIEDAIGKARKELGLSPLRSIRMYKEKLLELMN